MIKDLCDGIISSTEQRLAFDTRMRQRASALVADSGMSIEGRVTYMKLRGDQLLHLAEMARHNGLPMTECEGLAAEALEAYVAAQDEASARMVDSKNDDNHADSSASNGGIKSGGSSSTLPEIHTLQLELVLRISSVLFYLLDRPIEAWEAGYPTYLAAAERPARLGVRGLAVTQALRDHLACIDISGGGGGYQQERKGKYRDDLTSHVQQQGEALVRNEWGFLRMSAGVDGGYGGVAGVGSTASKQLWALAQVKQARACMDSVATTKRVLLGTMENADAVKSALKQIFGLYTRQHSKPVQQCAKGEMDKAGKQFRSQGRKYPLGNKFRQEGSSLPWPGFEAVCQDFNITAAAAVSPTVHPPHSLAHLHRHFNTTNPSRDPLPDHRRSPRPDLFVPTSVAKPRPGSSMKMLSGETTGSALLNVVQARIAFVAASTHGSVVASFPDEGGGASDFGNGRGGGPGIVKRAQNRLSRSVSAEENEKTSRTDEDAVFWRGIERVVLSGFTPDDSINELGLSFRQFVDALARCGLIGFTKSTGIGVREGAKRFVSAAERVQAVFITQMGLLDRQQVDAKLKQLTGHQVDGSAAEGEPDKARAGKKGGGKHATRVGKSEVM